MKRPLVPRFLPAVLCCFVILGAGCNKRETDVTRGIHEQVLHRGLAADLSSLDPHLITTLPEINVASALFEGLVGEHPETGAPVPAVAESWETSADGLTWTFHLRPDAKWSNGDPVTAQDFVYSIRRALTPATAAPKGPLFFALRQAREFFRGDLTDFSQVGVAAPDARTLVLTLDRPTEALLPLLASGPWLPVHRATVEREGRQWTRPGHFTGNGPFTLTEWLPNQRIIVQKNPRYWDAGAVQLAAIHFLAYDSGDTEERAFRAGQLDVTMATPFSRLEAYRRDAPELLQSVALHETRYLSLNTRRPPLNDARVRRALSLALDRRTLVDKVMKGGQQPAYGFVPPGLGGYAPQTRLNEDAASARRLLAEAGFPGGKGFPPLEITAWGVGNLVLEAIQQRWHTELGIPVAVVQREARTHLAALAAGDYEVALVAAIPDYDSPLDLLQHFTTGNAGNYPQWSNAAFDRLVADPAGLPAAEQVLLDELPLIPLYFNNKNFLRRPAVHGWREDALWTRYYKHVSIEHD